MAWTVKLCEPEESGLPLNLWSEPRFMKAVQTLHRAQAWHVQCWKGQKLMAILPIYEKSLLSYRAIISPSSAYYNGLNLYLEENSNPARKLLDTLQIMQSMAGFINNRYQRVHFNLEPEIMDVRGFTWNKLKARPFYTFQHDYSSPLRPLPDEKKKAATARNQSYRFSENFEVESFIRLFSDLYRRKHKSLGFGRDAFAVFFSSLYEQGLLKQFNIYREERIVCSNMLYYSPAGTLYAVFRATDEQEMKWGANILLTQELIGHVAPYVRRIDFCGANVPDVARFKAAEGLQLQVFYQIYR